MHKNTSAELTFLRRRLADAPQRTFTTLRMRGDKIFPTQESVAGASRCQSRCTCHRRHADIGTRRWKTTHHITCHHGFVTRPGSITEREERRHERYCVPCGPEENGWLSLFTYHSLLERQKSCCARVSRSCRTTCYCWEEKAQMD